MAISTSKTEIFAEGTTDISWTSLQNNLGGQEPTNIRFGSYKRNPNDDSENPIVPDATENAEIGTEESGNLRVGAFRGAISQYDVSFGSASEYQNVEFEKYFGNNIIKNVPKNINVDGIIYSDDVNEPAASINVTNSIRNLTIGIGTTGAIYGAGAAATTATQGISGGTALYVAGTSSRNFKINLESAGGSFGKLYGGGGGGVTGSPGITDTRNSCVRSDDTSFRQIQPRTCTGRGRDGSRGTPGNNPTTHNFQVQHTGRQIPARQWNEKAQQRCRDAFGGNAFGGGCSDIIEVRRYYDVQVNGPVLGKYCFFRSTPRPDIPGPTRSPVQYLQGFFRYKCNIPGNPDRNDRGRDSFNYNCDSRTFISQSRGESGGITSPGGTGGPGGRGEGYQRAFTSGTVGNTATPANCSSLGAFSGPVATGGVGSPGTSGGAFGLPGESSDVATGGPAGFAIQKTSAEIDIEIIGATEDRLKGQTN